MSRIGKKLIEIPQGVTVEISEKEIKVQKNYDFNEINIIIITIPQYHQYHHHH